MDKKTIIIAGIAIALTVSVFTYGYFTSREDEKEKLNEVQTVFQNSQYAIYVSQNTQSNKGWFKSVQGIPELSKLDQVIVDGTFPFENLKEGMMVIFRSRSQSAHRSENTIHPIVRKKGDGWVTKGYANNEEDKFIMTKENYMGLAVAVLYENGTRKELKY